MPVEQIKVIVPSVTVTWTKHSYIFLLLSGLLTHASQLWRGDLIQALCRKCFLESKWLASWRFSINGCSFQLVLLCKDSLQTEIFHSILHSLAGWMERYLLHPCKLPLSLIYGSECYCMWLVSTKVTTQSHDGGERGRQYRHLPQGQNLRGIKKLK